MPALDCSNSAHLAEQRAPGLISSSAEQVVQEEEEKSNSHTHQASATMTETSSSRTILMIKEQSIVHSVNYYSIYFGHFIFEQEVQKTLWGLTS